MITVTCPKCGGSVQMGFEHGEPATFDYPGTGPIAILLQREWCCEATSEDSTAIEDLAMEQYEDFCRSEDEDRALSGFSLDF